MPPGGIIIPITTISLLRLRPKGIYIRRASKLSYLKTLKTIPTFPILILPKESLMKSPIPQRNKYINLLAIQNVLGD